MLNQPLMDQLIRLRALDQWEGLTKRTPTTGFDGAREAADLICAFLDGRDGAARSAPRETAREARGIAE